MDKWHICWQHLLSSKSKFDLQLQRHRFLQENRGILASIASSWGLLHCDYHAWNLLKRILLLDILDFPAETYPSTMPTVLWLANVDTGFYYLLPI
jgi:hypothetical protein